MKKRKIVMSVLIVTMLASCMACGKIHDNKGNTFKKDVTEKVTISDTEVAKDVKPVDIKVDDLKPLADAGVITGVKDITVAEGTDVKLNDLVYADKTIVKSVDVDASKVDYSKTGTYEVIYTITFDGDKLRDYVKENNLKMNFDVTGDTIVVKTTVTVTVATKEDAEKAIANGNTDVVTPETKESVAESNKAKANDNATVSKPAEKPAGNTGNSNAGKNNSGNNSGNAGNSNSKPAESKPAESKPSDGNNSSTEEPHKHSYDDGVVTVQPTCTTPGKKVYTCIKGDHSYEETLPTTAHDYVQRTEPVTVKEAWTEDVLEPRYICNGCGATFKNDDDAVAHIIDDPSGHCDNYHSEAVKVNTIDHPAVIETRTYTVCSHCGKRP